MKHLAGFRNYLNTAYEQSVFERALAVQDLWACHLHTRRMARLRVTANLTHDLQVDVEGEGPEDLARKTCLSCMSSSCTQPPTPPRWRPSSSSTRASGRRGSNHFCRRQPAIT